MTIDIKTAAAFFTLLQFFLVFCWWIITGRLVSYKECKKCRDEFKIEVETKIKDKLPDSTSLKKLEVEFAEFKGTMHAIEKQFSPLQSSISRIEEYLLNQGK